MDRRHFLGTGLAAGVAGTVAAGGQSAVAATRAASRGASVRIDTTALRSQAGRKIPVDRNRASAILEEHQLDGLIALQPHNVYYLTNTTTTLTRFTDEYPAFATLPRDLQQPAFLVSSTGNTWETANGEREVPPVIAFSGPANWSEYVNASPDKLREEPQSAARNYRNAVAAGASLTPREQGWKDAQDRYNPQSAGSREWALVHALRQSGLLNGRVAVDDMRVAYLLKRIGIESLTIVPGENIFRQIRHIKGAHEIESLRIAQQITQQAVMAAARSMQEGMTFGEFRQRFFTEGVARGGEPGFVLLGVTQGLLPHGVVKRGQTYLLDCSIHFNNYHGDFARTVCVGEPSAEAMRRFKAQQIGRQAAFEIIKAGVPFRKVEQVAREAMVAAGMPPDVPVIGLHSVGLQHGDDPARFDVPFGVRGDLVLAENMTVTLDLPYVEIGGPAGHNEDLLRITANGYELLNDPAEPLVIV